MGQDINAGIYSRIALKSSLTGGSRYKYKSYMSF